MVVAKGARRLIATGIVGLGVIGAATLPILLSRANDAATADVVAPVARQPLAPAVEASLVDPLTTGSIPAKAPVAESKAASATFKEALELLADGKRTDAFALADSIADTAERHAIQWAAIFYGNGAVPAASVQKFIADAPDFVASPVFKTRLEEALTREKADGATLIKALGGAMPSTLAAQIALAEAYVADGQKERAARIARAIWTENFLDKATEARVLDRLGNLLDRDAHWARAMHLMMHDRATGVERLMQYLTPAQKSLAVARNAVSRNAKDAKKLLDAVDPSMRGNSVYQFSRAQRARQFELWDDAITWLDKAKGEPVDAAEFWYERRTLARQLLALGEVKRAYRAADGYREGPDGRLVEAHFHAGWIALAFLKDAEAAASHFEEMTKHSTLPDSVTQANYWLGRARQALGDESGAAEAFSNAAAFGTIYYGQLARSALGKPSTELRDMPSWKEAEAGFEAREPVRAVKLLAENGHKELAIPLLRSFADGFTDGADLLLSARLAQSLDAHHLAIAIADTAEKRGIPLDPFNFPKDGLPSTKLASMDHAAIYAITRQESRFQVDAISSAGARGLMQLMPATAKETAGKLGVKYSASRLTSDGAYNALLGSTYLKAQLERFDGSLLLAAAAYNAGAGNARKWMNTFGDPRSEAIDPVVWVELIPVQETRTYVKRVLGNYLVYRARLGKDDLSIGEALRKIPG
ncbi:MAG TPA: lytic transglycosylase domain-containing protein [Devosia sp.]|jgi:soluble lytic murein transglycosylase|uniref:lytic transglycosylase domain-containing protein n=1 Tax=Devosia sp. TaxID=1871048 RepID=UPI002DDCE29A|nr:lytic transglycosylase domain-containing protein [Devosia sp.]HEV2517390.1 lytic transglycosylase domain-containing protein [Devosia sp.]